MAFYFSYFQKGRYDFGESIVKDVTRINTYTTIFSEIADDVSFFTFYTMQPGQRLDEISQELYSTPEFYWTIPLVNDRIINTWNDLPRSYSDFISFLERKHTGRAFKIRNDQTPAGKFQIGEFLKLEDDYIKTGYVQNNYVALDGPVSNSRAKLIGKYPTQGYLQVVFVDQTTFPQNSEFIIVGESSGDSIVITNHIPTYDAPARHVDTNGNFVSYNSGQATPITIRQDEEDRNDIISQIKVIRPEFIYDVSTRFEQEMRRRRRSTA